MNSGVPPLFIVGFDFVESADFRVDRVEATGVYDKRGASRARARIIRVSTFCLQRLPLSCDGTVGVDGLLILKYQQAANVEADVLVLAFQGLLAPFSGHPTECIHMAIDQIGRKIVLQERIEP